MNYCKYLYTNTRNLIETQEQESNNLAESKQDLLKSKQDLLDRIEELNTVETDYYDQGIVFIRVHT